MQEFHNEGNLSQLIAAHPILLVQFGAESCPACKSIRQRLDAWTAQHTAVGAIYISVPDYPALAAQEQIFTVPTIVVYVNGQCTLRESGYFSLDLIFSQLQRYLDLLDVETKQFSE